MAHALGAENELRRGSPLGSSKTECQFSLSTRAASENRHTEQTRSVQKKRPWLRHAALEGSGKATARVSLRPDGARQKAVIHADVTNLWLDGVVAGDRLQVGHIIGKFEASDLRTQGGLSIDTWSSDESSNKSEQIGPLCVSRRAEGISGS